MLLFIAFVKLIISVFDKLGSFNALNNLPMFSGFSENLASDKSSNILVLDPLVKLLLKPIINLEYLSFALTQSLFVFKVPLTT